MILSNLSILQGIRDGLFTIGSLTGNEDPLKKPFNTSAVDLHLSTDIRAPKNKHTIIDLRHGVSAPLLADLYEDVSPRHGQGYILDPGSFILAKTVETVSFPIRSGGPNYSARVEGKSSLARCGILVHFTAPTIHANFNGTIALEVANLGKFPLCLYPNYPFCQLIIEKVDGEVADSPNQFSGQQSPTGGKA